MYQTEIKLRVRYAETDRMGYSYYGNYATYFEVARVEALRSLGISYRQIEDSGILLPVSEYSVKFLKPAYYDDELLIITKIPRIPTAKITFEYQTFRGDELLNTAHTDLVFVTKSTGRPMRCPEFIRLVFEKYYTNVT
ncbi:MAG: thioesterase family protein [Flavobacteriales bacterium]|nr:thioesterase family protein [Flavobacteriales bacterium]